MAASAFLLWLYDKTKFWLKGISVRLELAESHNISKYSL